MIYALNFSKKALKELANIHDPFYSAVKRDITNLTINPRPQGYKKLKDRDGYRIRTGNYRIIYDILIMNFSLILLPLDIEKTFTNNYTYIRWYFAQWVSCSFGKRIAIKMMKM